MRLLLTLLALIVSLVPTAVAAFFAVIFLAGPHGGVLPASLHTATLVLAWLCVLVIPMLVARWAWRRQSRSAEERRRCRAESYPDYEKFKKEREPARGASK